MKPKWSDPWVNGVAVIVVGQESIGEDGKAYRFITFYGDKGETLSLHVLGSASSLPVKAETLIIEESL